MITPGIMFLGIFGGTISREGCRKSGGSGKRFYPQKKPPRRRLFYNNRAGELFAAQIFQTARADVFPLEGRDLPGIPTENAGRLVLVQDDGRSVNVDLQWVAFRDVRVRRSSIGSTMRPSSSTFRTIPVAFIFEILLAPCVKILCVTYFVFIITQRIILSIKKLGKIRNFWELCRFVPWRPFPGTCFWALCRIYRGSEKGGCDIWRCR